MKLYSEKDVRDFHFLANKYMELADNVEKVMKEKPSRSEFDIECKFALTQVQTTKDMMDNLGIEVPDDKAKELGFEL